MKTVKVKCYQCKTDNEINSKTFDRLITCKHCKKKMILSNREFKKLKFIRYIMLLVVSGIFMFIFSFIAYKNNSQLAYLPLIIFVSLMLFFAGEADKLTYKILFALSKNIEYVEYVPEPKEKKTAPKKKGWFR